MKRHLFRSLLSAAVIARSAVVIPFGFLLLAGPASAEENPAEPAAAMLAEGKRLLGELKFDPAVRKLTETLSALGQPAPANEASFTLFCRALDLRAQAEISLGRAKKAEADFALLVRTNPSYQLDEKTVSPKIVQRFRKVRSGLIGFVNVACDPEGATLTIDGQPSGSCPLADRAVVAGEHVLAGSHAGFDPAELPVTVGPGEKKDLRLVLTPNARAVILQTVPSGVEVIVDGASAGVTAAGPEGEEGVSASFTLAALAPGEHEVTFRKVCHAEQSRRFMVVVDLIDRTPVVLKPVEVPRATARLSVVSLPAGATVLFDGEPIGQTPLAEREVCAGKRSLEVAFAEGIRWHESLDIAAGRSLQISTHPKAELWLSLEADPAATMGLTEDERLGILDRVREAATGLRNYNLNELAAASAAPAADSGGIKPASDAGGAKHGEARGEKSGLTLSVRLLPGTVSPRLRFSVASPFHAAPESWEFDAADGARWGGMLSRFDEPLRLQAPATGLILLDTLLAGGPIVLSVRPGPAAEAGFAPGDEIVSVDGQKVAGAATLHKMWSDAQRPPSSRAIEIRRQGTVRQMTLFPAPAPTLLPFAESAGASTSNGGILSYHKAAVEASLAASIAPGEPARSIAVLNLMAALLHFGENAQALREAARHLDLPAGAGISRATLSYLSGIACERLGMKGEAAEAFRSAAGDDEATLDSLEGVPLAPAARVRADILSAGSSSPQPSFEQPPPRSGPGKPEGQRPPR